MSFLFPQRTYRHMLGVLRQIDPNAAELKFLEEAAEEDEREGTFYGLKWIRSFIPTTPEFNRRMLWTQRIVKAQAGVTNIIDERYPNSFLYRTFLKTVAFPSWGKTIFLLFSMLLMLSVAVIGLGALLQILGVSVGPFGFLAQLGFNVISFLAAPLSISAFNLSIIATAIGAFFACLSFGELYTPGTIFKFVGLWSQRC